MQRLVPLRRLLRVSSESEGVNAMRAMMLGSVAALAGLGALASPAAAQRWSEPGFVAAAAVTVHRGSDHGATPPRPDRSGDFRSERRRDRDRDGDFGYVVYSGEWARWNNRSWEPTSYNDWWHDRPDRSLPRWVQGNQGCERQWWSGAGWRC
jgi:hypothetical protein